MSAVAPATEEKKDVITALYDAYEKLSDATLADQHESWYNVIIGAVHGEPRVKQLVCQFLPRFFHQVPKLQEVALNAQLDLCEDETASIRLAAITGLGEICKHSPPHIKQIADVLGQLLITEEKSELEMVKRTFEKLFEMDMKNVFEGLFSQIREGDDNVRDKVIQFLKTQSQTHANKINANEELQKAIADNIKRVLAVQQRVSANEFRTFLEVLRKLKIFKADKEMGKEIGAILADRSGIKKDFEPTNEDAIQKLVLCQSLALTLGQGNDPTEFLDFFASKVLPVFDQVSEKNKLAILKAVADASRYASKEVAVRLLPVIYEQLKIHVPASADAVPVVASSSAPAAPAVDPESKTPIAPIAPLAQSAGVKINFSLVECLLVVFHHLASKDANALKDVAGIFTPTGQPSDFRAGLREKKEALTTRLEFLKTNLTSYSAQVKAVDAKLKEKASEAKDDEAKKAHAEKKQSVQVALATTRSLENLTSALLAKPPKVLSGPAVSPSWAKKTRPARQGGEQKEENKEGGRKRTASTGASAGGKKQKTGNVPLANNGPRKRNNNNNNNNNNGGNNSGNGQSQRGGRGGGRGGKRQKGNDGQQNGGQQGQGQGQGRSQSVGRGGRRGGRGGRGRGGRQ